MAQQTKDLLHILRSVPDDETQKMMAELSADVDADVIKLYNAEMDWEEVVDAIFSHSRIVCWW
jgi:Ca2+-binding EF-hand superfamily protein